MKSYDLTDSRLIVRALNPDTGVALADPEFQAHLESATDADTRKATAERLLHARRKARREAA